MAVPTASSARSRLSSSSARISPESSNAPSENVNLRTRLELIVSRADLETWPKLFQNLRASRADVMVPECCVLGTPGENMYSKLLGTLDVTRFLVGAMPSGGTRTGSRSPAIR